jgi:hypothetical protein
MLQLCFQIVCLVIFSLLYVLCLVRLVCSESVLRFIVSHELGI